MPRPGWLALPPDRYPGRLFRPVRVRKYVIVHIPRNEVCTAATIYQSVSPASFCLRAVTYVPLSWFSVRRRDDECRYSRLTHFVLRRCSMRRRLSSRRTLLSISLSAFTFTSCTRRAGGISSLCFPFARGNSRQVGTKHSWSIFFNGHGALITYYDHLNRASLLPLSQQQRTHYTHAGSDDDKVCRKGLGTLGPRLSLSPIEVPLNIASRLLSSPFITRLHPICLHWELTFHLDGGYCSLTSILSRSSPIAPHF